MDKITHISQLTPDPINARLHTESNMAVLEKSLEEVGAARSIVIDEDGRILAGNATIEAAGNLGIEAVQVIQADGNTIIAVQRTGLTEEQKTRLALYDNRAAELASWDPLNLRRLADEYEIADIFGGDTLAAMLAMLEAAGAGVLPTEGEVEAARVTLAERFGVPPFTVLNAREGTWQRRKKAWLALGIKSELGRGDNLLEFSPMTKDIGHYRDQRAAKMGGNPPVAIDGKAGLLIDQYRRKAKAAAGAIETDVNPDKLTTATSIFDPVLTELAYRWFCPPNADILDPFAGGSVRGVVAGMLGHNYTGIDLSGPQVAANRQQWRDISRAAAPALTAEITELTEDAEPMISIKVSAKSLRLKMDGCQYDTIMNKCHGQCCHSDSKPGGTLITINPREQARIEALGGVVVNGLLQTPNRRCQWQQASGLCDLHLSGQKPFGCIASPFTLNKSGTLILRNRFKLFKCYGVGDMVYRSYRASLNHIFGEAEAERICQHLEAGGGDIVANITKLNFDTMMENDAIKHGRLTEQTERPKGDVDWFIGDSRGLAGITDNQQYDFIFTCPPYGDLEVYSDDTADLSTYDWPEFLVAYNEIIAAAVGQLKPNRFAAVCVGDFRDKQGFYRNFVSETIAAFEAAGAKLYNEAILVTMCGSLPVRVTRSFIASRKLGKTHQNVLVFYKGDPSTIGQDYPDNVEFNADWLPDETGDESNE